MRTIGKLILGLAVVVLFGVATTPALATPVWQVCTNLETKIGLFEDKGCTKEKTEGEYEWLGVGSTEKVSMVAMTIRLEDSKTAAGKTTVQCGHGVGAGVIGPENKGLITEIKVNAPKTECERVEGGCEAGEVEKVEGRNLPWQTEIFETEKKFLTKIEATTSGKEPGWAVACNTLLGKKTDECLQEEAKPEFAELENRESGTEKELLVLARLEKKRMSKCTEGGAEAGLESGSVGMEGNGGAGLRVRSSEGQFEAISGSYPVSIETESLAPATFVFDNEKGELVGELQCGIGSYTGKIEHISSSLRAAPTFEECKGTLGGEAVEKTDATPAGCEFEFQILKSKPKEWGGKLIIKDVPGKKCEQQLPNKIPFCSPITIKLENAKGELVAKVRETAKKEAELEIELKKLEYKTPGACPIPNGKVNFKHKLLIKNLTIK